MARLDDLLHRIRRNPGCTVAPPTEAAVQLEPGHRLPADLQEFYQLCGGVRLFQGQALEIAVLAASEVVQSNPVIVGERVPEDISDSWYLICQTPNGEHISIDLGNQRLGRCYDSFYEVHGVAGSCAVIATSFSELLARLYSGGAGDGWYWLDEDFVAHSDAYDQE